MTVHLQRAVKGAVAAEVRWLESIGRRVVWVDVDESVRRGALSAEASGVIAHAADTAREKGLPLVMAIGSSGADIVGGVAALHGWGQAAKATRAVDCSFTSRTQLPTSTSFATDRLNGERTVFHFIRNGTEGNMK